MNESKRRAGIEVSHSLPYLLMRHSKGNVLNFCLKKFVAAYAIVMALSRKRRLHELRRLCLTCGANGRTSIAAVISGQLEKKSAKL